MPADDMRRDFTDRDDLIAYVRAHFPDAGAPEHVADTRGGRAAALARLAAADYARYAATRNRLDGAVTRLSPYLRHGVLSLAEVRDDAQAHGAPDKFINELAWRDFYQRVYAAEGDGIWDDREAYKTGFSAESYAPTLPDDIRTGTTGTCLDLFIAELLTTGAIHNHARMWLAAYVVHWRRVRWQAGARWFLEHLLDGDPASNNLSWQWVASTFSHKPYFFNADNIRRFAADRYPQLRAGRLEPFEGSYDALARRLFPHLPPDQPVADSGPRRRPR